MSGRFGIAILGALLAVVLQIVLAPNIAIMGTMPHFIIAYAVAISLVLPRNQVYVLVFVLGMIGDLLGYGPVGALYRGPCHRLCPEDLWQWNTFCVLHYRDCFYHRGAFSSRGFYGGNDIDLFRSRCFFAHRHPRSFV